MPLRYRLTSNLNFAGAPTEPIDVDADPVTIDLNGFVIGTCVGATGICIRPRIGNGIDALGDSDLTVRNGTLSNNVGYGENVFQDNGGNAEPQVHVGCVNLGSNLCRSSANATCP